MNAEIQSMLVLSILHVSKDTAALLNAKDSERLLWGPQWSWDHGWMWYVDGDTHGLVDFPAEFEAIFKLARSHGCCWVRFDESGPTLDSLPRFDW